MYGSPTNDVLLNMGLQGHNDAVSSFKVRQIPPGQVKLCRYHDCSGGHVYYASVGSWTSMPSTIGNDTLSYVFIPRGFKFQYFQDTDFGGCSQTIGSNDYDTNLVFHDETGVSSFKSFMISVGCSWYDVKCWANKAGNGICKVAYAGLKATGSKVACDAACVAIVEAAGGGPEDPVADYVATYCPIICGAIFDHLVDGVTPSAAEVCDPLFPTV